MDVINIGDGVTVKYCQGNILILKTEDEKLPSNHNEIWLTYHSMQRLYEFYKHVASNDGVDDAS